ncbi:TatD family hydrolase [Hahella sp. SMD15-11]|uniref:TatD family hydrolase n=1 Tax=Thermohahella caldifontis TaxID=3142973 RepID=A0AB39URV0_9GAMM
MGWVDIGVNLTGRRFDRDRDRVIAEAVEQGVTHMIVTGTSVTESERALALARQYPGILTATAGCHPHHASELDDEGLERLRALQEESEVVAVGECGLDYNRDFSPRDVQRQVFEAQLEQAADARKPVFLHERDAFEDQYAILRNAMPRLVGGVAHCFTGDEAALDAWLDLGLYIGITGWVCDVRRGKPLLDLVHRIPDNRLLLETDAPYLLPHNLPDPPRDKRNRPAFLPWVARRVAEARGQTLEHLMAITTRNAIRLFGLDLSG